KKHLAPLVAEMRRHRPGLRFTAVEIDRLSERQAVQDLLALTCALHHRADRVNWLAILRAPWCGLTLGDMHALVGDDHQATLWSLMADEARLARLSADGQGRLRHLRAVLAEAFAHHGRQRTRRWIEGVWLALSGAACLETAADGADAAAFLDLVDRLEAAGRFSVDSLAAETENLFAAPDALADGRLQFMSIHKAKGLEFDTVIVPGLHRRPRKGDQPLVLWEPVLLDEFEEGLLAAPMRSGTKKDATLYGYLKELESERAGHEDERLLYVAATRAERALHWVAAVAPGAEGEIRPPAGSLLALLWPAVAAEFASATIHTDAAEAAAAAAPLPPLRRLVEVGTPPWLQHRAAAAAAGGGSEAAEEEGDSLDALVGTLVHAYLEMVARQGLDAWPVERIRRLGPAMTVWFGQQGCAGPDAEDGVERVQAALAATLASDDGRRVLEARQDAAAELALVRADGQAASLHIVDRTFVDKGVRWIVDYKTARVEAAAAAAQAERHRLQLDRYAVLFAADGLPIRLGVFYTALGKLIELP
ncbi:MAG TPA: 3'-5' exonuclease, partial [Rhodocyclaceae bacterium]|nr:3'-5' exonuclease [Rhodocyclaceae bacterium]